MLNGSIWNKIPMFALPVAATAVLILAALIVFRPANKLLKNNWRVKNDSFNEKN